MTSIKNALLDIGLTHGEVEVYIALLEIGKSGTGKLTKSSGISSSKVYEVLSRLQSKGLVSYFIEEGHKKYWATPPERIIDFLEEKKMGLGKSQATIKKMLPEFNKKRESNSEIPEAVVYKGDKGPIIVLDDLNALLLQGHEVIGFGTNDDGFETYYPAKLKEHIQLGEKHGFKIKILFGEGFKSIHTFAKIRYLPREYITPIRTIVCKNKTYIIDFSEPKTTIIIEKETIANAYKEQFHMLWKIAKKK